MSSILVLFSGGQDSTTVLLDAIRKFDRVEAIGFYYGQRHSIENEIAENICNLLNVNYRLVDVKNIFELNGKISALTNGEFDVTDKRNDGLPKTFVPNRNMLFLTIADIYAKSLGIRDIAIGVSGVDYSGYPDCRPEFIKSFQSAISLSSGGTMVHTPLIDKTKAETFLLAKELGEVGFIIEYTHTCYKGDRTMHEWGAGCGECPACKLREKGYNEFVNKWGNWKH